MFNLEKFGIKRSKAETNEKNQEVNETRDGLIREVYEKGKLAILSAFMVLCMHGDQKDVKPGVLEFQNKFKNITKEQAASVYSDMKDIVSETELREVMTLDSTLPEHVLDKNFRESFKRLSKMFTVSSFDIIYSNKVLAENFKDEKVWHNIQSMRSAFHGEGNPHAEVLNLTFHPELLKDPNFVKGIERLASLGYDSENEIANDCIVRGVGENDNFFKLFQRMRELGGVPNGNIFVALHENGPFDMDREWIEKNKATVDPKIVALSHLHDYDIDSGKSFLVGAYELQDFLNSNENRFALAYSGGERIGFNEMHNLMTDKTGFWRDFFSGPTHRESIQILKNHGFTFSSLVKLNKEDASLLNDPEIQKLLIKLSELLSEQFIKERGVGDFLKNIKNYYDLSKPETVQVILREIDSVAAGVDKTWEGSFKIQEKFIAIKTKQARDNIASPASVGFHMNSDNLLKDPAMSIIYSLNYQDKIPTCLVGLEASEVSEWILRVARSMYVSQTPATEQDFERVYAEIVNLRLDKSLIDQPLFSKRNVALFANNEVWENQQERFAKKKLIEKIKEQNPSDVTLFKSKEDKDSSLSEVSKKFLEYISTHKNLTVLVDAHGGPDGIFLSQGAPDKAGNLTVSVRNTYVSTYDVALAFEKRYDNGITDVPIFIYSACYSQDFIRGLNEYLSTINSKKNKNIHMPIAMGETEYGQQGFSAVTESDGSEYGAKFFKLIFEGGNPSTSHTVRFKDVIQVEAGQRHLKMPSNISIFVPFEQKQDKAKKRPRHTYYQIAQADTKTEREYDIHKIDGVKQEIDEIISART